MNILILCTGNSCRSQIADGYLRQFVKNIANVYSAGTQTHGVNPNAIRVMAEDGIDISQHTSNLLDEYSDIEFDYVITVCDNAKKVCPVFPGNGKMIHHSFSDPASAKGSDDEIMNSFRKVRDKIKLFCQVWSKSEILAPLEMTQNN
ncbi:MAG: arsenate reductase ArsC [Saprospiraceae bacterium]